MVPKSSYDASGIFEFHFLRLKDFGPSLTKNLFMDLHSPHLAIALLSPKDFIELLPNEKMYNSISLVMKFGI